MPAAAVVLRAASVVSLVWVPHLLNRILSTLVHLLMVRQLCVKCACCVGGQQRSERRVIQMHLHVVIDAVRTMWLAECPTHAA